MKAAHVLPRPYRPASVHYFVPESITQRGAGRIYSNAVEHTLRAAAGREKTKEKRNYFSLRPVLSPLATNIK